MNCFKIIRKFYNFVNKIPKVPERDWKISPLFHSEISNRVQNIKSWKNLEEFDRDQFLEFMKDNEFLFRYYLKFAPFACSGTYCALNLTFVIESNYIENLKAL